MAMGHAVHIRSQEQFVEVLRVLNKLSGTWRGIGTSSEPVLLLTDAQFNALVAAGVVPANDKEGSAHGKKATAKKAKP
jgi:hypothetical protein